MAVNAGSVYGSWTVVGLEEGRMVRCRCRCGTEKMVPTSNLLHGRSRSCGCSRFNVAIAAGDRFGRLRVVDASVRMAVLCRCDCGAEVAVKAVHLVASAKTSCGCLRRENTRNTGRSNRTHGLSGHELYGTWTRMVARCSNPNNWDYKYYGGRGIRVHEPWLRVSVFIPEIIALIGERPKGLTLDRIDVNGDYEPRNVRWATRAEQSRNQRARQ